MTYFRIDNRRFEIGDIITPQTEFLKRADAKRLLIEGILCQTKPTDKPDRNKILKVFSDCNAAKKFWILTTNSIFYEVKINEENILHIGDYNLIQQIYTEKDTNVKITLAEKYWNDIPNENTEKEYFVLQAEVKRIISDSEEERENTKKAYYGFETNQRVRIINCDNI